MTDFNIISFVNLSQALKSTSLIRFHLSILISVHVPLKHANQDSKFKFHKEPRVLMRNDPNLVKPFYVLLKLPYNCAILKNQPSAAI